MRFTIPKLNHPAILLLFCSVLVLTGCASGLSKEECEVIDWRAIGYEDGLRGLQQSRVTQHRKDCAEYGVALDLDSYQAGWQEGIDSYCRPGNGYRQGLAGAEYQGVCPAHQEAAFLEAYASGHRLYALEREVNQLNQELRSAQRRLDYLEEKIRDTGIELVAPGLATKQRVVLLDELRRLEAEHSDLQHHVIPDLEERLAWRRSDLAQLRADQRF